MTLNDHAPLEFRDISRVSEAITAKLMKIDPYCQRRNCSPLNALFSNVDIAGRSRSMGHQASAGWVKLAIFEQNVSISLDRWRWRLLQYFKQVVNLSATCFRVELEQFSACFRIARVCRRQLGFLVLAHDSIIMQSMLLCPSTRPSVRSVSKTVKDMQFSPLYLYFCGISFIEKFHAFSVGRGR